MELERFQETSSFYASKQEIWNYFFSDIADCYYICFKLQETKIKNLQQELNDKISLTTQEKYQKLALINYSKAFEALIKISDSKYEVNDEIMNHFVPLTAEITTYRFVDEIGDLPIKIGREVTTLKRAMNVMISFYKDQPFREYFFNFVQKRMHENNKEPLHFDSPFPMNNLKTFILQQ